MPNGLPFGDAFIVGTPALDQLSNRIYAEHQQRELQRRQDNKMLDEEFSRNLSGIWDADIPELTQKYGEYKQSWQNLYKKKGGGTPQEQLEVLKKKADMYSLLGKSKEHRNWWEGKVKTVQSDKKGMFADDAATQLASIRGLPSAKADRTTIEGRLMYPYSLPEFDKWNKSSFGTPIERRGKQTTSANDPLKDETPIWKVGNTPNQMFENLLNTVVTKNAGKNFTGLVLNSMDDQQKQDLTNRFIAKTKDPKFIAAYGDVQPFNQTALSTDLGEAVALQTMKNFVDLPIPEPKIEAVINADRAKTRAAEIALSRQKIMEAIKQGNRKELVRIRRAFQVADQVRQDEILDDVIVGYKENPNAIPEDIKDEFKKRDGKGHSVDFNEVKFSPDGTKVQFLYKDEKGNVIPEFSAEATVSDIKERTRKKIETAQTDVTATPKATSGSGGIKKPTKKRPY